jgi:hypothetical protein
MVRKKSKHKTEHKTKEKKVKMRISTGNMSFFTVGLIIGLVIGLSMMNMLNQKNELTAEEAGEKAVNFISENLLTPGIKAELVSAEEIGGTGIYKISINLSSGSISQIAESYVTKDGSYLFPTGIPMTGAFAEKLKKSREESEEEKKKENVKEESITKSEKPEMKLFIMSHCPFGLQALKAYLPVYKLLKDKADMKIHFVSYIMHGKEELDENMRIYCIQKEQEDKLYDYLSCFVKDGDWETCLDEAGVDENKLESCIEATDEEYNITGMYNDRSTWSAGRFPKFPIDEDLNKLYGVRGSPTIVINGKITSVTRSPQGFLEAICSAFITPPEECNQTLSSSIASPGFGIGTASSSGGGCGG